TSGPMPSPGINTTGVAKVPSTAGLGAPLPVCAGGADCQDGRWAGGDHAGEGFVSSATILGGGQVDTSTCLLGWFSSTTGRGRCSVAAGAAALRCRALQAMVRHEVAAVVVLR